MKSKRTAVSGDSSDFSASTNYFATFEFADGSREEFSASSPLYAQVAEGDAGVLFTRANTVAAFDRVTDSASTIQ